MILKMFYVKLFRNHSKQKGPIMTIGYDVIVVGGGHAGCAAAAAAVRRQDGGRARFAIIVDQTFCASR
jgi:NADPH-dependent 2,4-dienoyl-CoA reductase/sulfur reductase-like enzyme